MTLRSVDRKGCLRVVSAPWVPSSSWWPRRHRGCGCNVQTPRDGKACFLSGGEVSRIAPSKVILPEATCIPQPADTGTKATIPAPASTSSQGPSQPQISSGFSLPPPTGGGPGTSPNTLPACRLSGASL